MKLTSYLILLFLIVGSRAFSQNFSGEIVYEISIIPKKKTINVDSIISLKKGSLARYLISDNYYKSTHVDNGKTTYSYTYDDTTKRMYDELTDGDYITYRDSRKANYKYYSSEIYRDSLKTILGMECFKVNYKSELGNSSTYYSNDVRVNYETFQGHKVGNWYNKLKEVDGCLTLKTITEFDDYFEVREAIEINKREVLKSEFVIPQSKLVVASFSALDKQVEMKSPNQKQIECYQIKLKLGTQKKVNVKSMTSYISFIITELGEIESIEPYEKDEYGLYKIALDIVKNCGFEFRPGEIKGNAVSSLTYFPIQFQFE